MKRARPMPAFLHHVVRVVGVASRPKVSRVAAARVVAGVKHYTAIDCAVCKFVGEAVRIDDLMLTRRDSDPKLPVASALFDGAR